MQPAPRIQLQNASQGRREYSWEEARTLVYSQTLPFDTAFCCEGEAIWRPLSEFPAIEQRVTGLPVAPIQGVPLTHIGAPDWNQTLPVQPLKPFAIAATVMIALACIAASVTISFDLQYMGKVTETLSDSEATRLNALFDLAGYTTLGLNLACGACWIAWHYRAAENVVRMGAKETNFGQLMTVVSYLVPIGSLFLPGFALSELMRTSRDPIGWKSVPVSAAPILFGVTWFLTSLTGISDWVGIDFWGPDVTKVVLSIDIWGQVFFILTGLVGLGILWKVTGLQDGSSHKRT